MLYSMLYIMVHTMLYLTEIAGGWGPLTLLVDGAVIAAGYITRYITPCTACYIIRYIPCYINSIYHVVYHTIYHGTYYVVCY